MGALAEAKAQGLTKLIGVSNFTVDLMREAIAAVGAGEIATNQVELHPYLQNRKVAEFARSQGIAITSYMTLAYGAVLKDPVIQADRRRAPGHAGPGRAGLGDAAGLRGDPVIDEAREPGEQPEGAATAAVR